jgi:type IX secretion system PorP/SprF family membrane protein
MKKALLHIIFVLSVVVVFGQDFHYSQFNYAPTNINPALAGHFDGKYRIHLNSRNQWRSFSSPFRTNGIAFDMDSLGKFPISPMISIYSDKAGDAKYGMIQINLGLAYKLTIKNHLFSPGIQFSLNNTNFNLEDLAFDRYGNADVIGGNQTNSSYNKINAGITWTYYFSKKIIFHNGFSLYNMFQQETGIISNFRNQQRFNFHGEAQIKSFGKFDLIPAYLVSYLANERNITAGSEIKVPMIIDKYYLKAVHASVFYRYGNAVILETGLNFNQVRIGLSYDLNVHSLNDNLVSGGGFEFSLRWIKPHKDRPVPFFRKCKDYL